MTADVLPVAVPLSAVDGVRVRGNGDLTAHKTITTRDPYLSGHYPGAPSYPGVFVLESVLQAARRLLGNPELTIAEIESVRFEAPLPPADTLHLTLTFHPVWDGDPGYLVRARGTRSDGTRAATVTVRCTEPRGRLRRTPRADRPVSLLSRRTELVNVRDLLPHRPPILLTDRVVGSVPGERVVTEFTVRANEPCYRHLPSEVDRMGCAYPDSLVLESFTQACTALLLLDRWRPERGTPVFGSARSVRLYEPVFPGQTLRHEVWLRRCDGDTALLHGQTTVDGRICLTTGTLAVVLRDEAIQLAAG